MSTPPTPDPQPPNVPPYPPAAGPYPAGWAPVPPPKKRSWFARHKVLTALLAVTALIVVFSAVGGGGSSDDRATGSEATSGDGTTTAAEGQTTEDGEAADVPAGLGTPVADGKFEFVVTQVETGVTRLGSDMFGQDSQGQFVLVHVTVTNIGDEAQYFDSSSQKLTDTEGRTHSADGSAAIYIENSESFLNQINPGVAVDAIVVFDIPATAVPATLELHDSPFSGGVTVTLG